MKRLELVLVRVASPEIRSALEAVIDALEQVEPEWLPAGSVNLKLVDDAAIRALNNKYSGQDKSTDVLSFSYIEDGQEPIEGELGDIVISRETAEEQAEAAGTDLATEVALLALHGILHICGFDHATPPQQSVIDRWQGEVLAAAGLTYRKFTWES